MTTTNQPAAATSWYGIIARYNQPSMARSIWQIINSVGSYLLLWVLIVQALNVSVWLALPLIILASGFLTRIFIIFHDCGHGSFFRSKKLNEAVGIACGILAFTPYHRWTDSHRIHHQTVGNLDKRGFGDVWTLTVDEYLAKSPWQRFIYRLFRHPLFLLGVGGPLMFILTNRFTTRLMTWKQRRNIYFTNSVMLTLAFLVSWLIGWQAFLLIQLSIMSIAAVLGVYLFYLQHQYEEVIWTRSEQWDYQKMAMHGSSFFKLPALFRWFTGNIGFHHIHHLGPTIPNYNLARCHEENPLFQAVKPITFFRSFRSFRLRLWDEKSQRIISFRELRRMTSAVVAGA